MIMIIVIMIFIIIIFLVVAQCWCHQGYVGLRLRLKIFNWKPALQSESVGFERS